MIEKMLLIWVLALALNELIYQRKIINLYRDGLPQVLAEHPRVK